MARISIPVYQFHERDGSVASAAKLYFYENKSNPPTLKRIFSDAEMLTVSPNPVNLGQDGYTPDIFGQGVYTVVCMTSDDVQLWVRDNVVINSTQGQFSDWSPIEEYSENAIVRADDGNYYISLTSFNIGQYPTDYPDSWSRIAFLRYWNQYETYQNTDIVVYGGVVYTSTIDNNLDNEPSPESPFWSLPFDADVVSIVFGALKTNVNWLGWRREDNDIYLDADLSLVIGQPNGAASLNANGKVPASQLDIAGGLQYQGTWNASTNTPALPTAAPANDGFYYVVSVAGTHAGTAYDVGDWTVSNGAAWERIQKEELGTVAIRDAVVSDDDKTPGRIPDVEWMTNKGLGSENNILPAEIATPALIKGVGVRFGMVDGNAIGIPGSAPGAYGMLIINGISTTQTAALSIEFVGGGQRWLRQAVNDTTWADWGQSGGGGGHQSSEIPGVIVIGDVATSGSETVTIDLAAGHTFIMSMNSADPLGALSFNFINPPSSGNVDCYLVIVRAGRKTITLPSGSSWAQNITPPLNAALNSRSVIQVSRFYFETAGRYRFIQNSSETQL